MFGRKIVDSELGPIKRSWGCWIGRIRLAAFKENIELVIKTPRGVNLNPYLERVRFLVNNFERYQEPLALQLFEDYNFYKRIDLDEGVFSEEDFLKHPRVEKPGDIWNVLTPYHLRVADTVGKYHGNAYILFDVDWPNPHYFQVYLNLEPDEVVHMHTEFVG